MELLAQEHLVFSRGHAFEQLEEHLLLLGGRWKHIVCLDVIERFYPGGESLGHAIQIHRTLTLTLTLPLTLTLTLTLTS